VLDLCDTLIKSQKINANTKNDSNFSKLVSDLGFDFATKVENHAKTEVEAFA